MLKTGYQTIKKVFKLPQILNFFGHWLSDREKQEIIKIFKKSDANDQELYLKLKIYSLLKALQKRRRKEFGFLVVFGWEKQWLEDYASFPDASQNLFSEKQVSLIKLSFDKALEIFSKLSYFDGAVLIGRKGNLVASGVYLENMQPKAVAEKMKLKKTIDLSQAFGFAKKVHTRHLAGIACSYKLPKTTVFVVSEESKVLRIFEKGKIVFSSLRQESATED
ncbi:MAG: diadenylate cyclase [Patescibacteria group bacterium]